MKFSFFEIFWILLITLSLWPLFKHKNIERLRYKAIRSIEQKRKSRVITIIHRQELISILGLPLTRYINIEDSEQVLRAIRLTPDQMPIDILLHTPGGLVLVSEQIALALKRHPAKVTVFIPHYAMSGGTMITLAADEIVMDPNAVVGPVDPQLGEYPAVSILKTVERKETNKVDDRTLIMADIAAKAMRQVKNFITELLKDRIPDEKARHIAEILSSGAWTHDYPITCEQFQQLGISVSCMLPNEIHRLMELYPQPSQRRPSVQYVPLPYKGNPPKS
jgi:ClpP class serine protease